jgi:gas vesicle protein
MSKDSVSFGMGLLFGIVAGVAAGVVLAPKSGEEMRQDLKNVIQNISNEDEINNCKNVSIDMINRMKYTIEKQLLKHKHIVVSTIPLQLKDDDEAMKSLKYNAGKKKPW